VFRFDCSLFINFHPADRIDRHKTPKHSHYFYFSSPIPLQRD
jgi:hypothetical protein